MLPRRSNQIYHDVLVAINPGRPCGHQGPTRDPIRTSPSTSWIRRARARASGGPAALPKPRLTPRHVTPDPPRLGANRVAVLSSLCAWDPPKPTGRLASRPPAVTSPAYIYRGGSRCALPSTICISHAEKRKKGRRKCTRRSVQREPGLAGGEPAGDGGGAAAAAAAAWRGGGGEEGGGGARWWWWVGAVLPEPRREAAAAGARGQPGGARGRRRGRARRGGRRRRRRRAAGGVRRREAPRRARPAHGRAHLRRARAHSEGGRCTLALNQQRSSDQAVFLFFFFLSPIRFKSSDAFSFFFFMALIMVL